MLLHIIWQYTYVNSYLRQYTDANLYYAMIHWFLSLLSDTTLMLLPITWQHIDPNHYIRQYTDADPYYPIFIMRQYNDANT